MTMRVGSKNFPDTLSEILKDRAFLDAFAKHLKDKTAFENVQFYLAAERGVKPGSLYKNFISDMSRKPINISSSVRKNMDDLAAQNNFEPGAWAAYINSAKVEIYNLMNTNFYSSFFKSDGYLALLEKTVMPTLKSVPSNLLGNAKLKDNKTLVKDKNLLACVKYTKMALVLKEKFHPKASGVKKIATKQFEQLCKKHNVKMKFDQWEKFVGMSL